MFTITPGIKIIDTKFLVGKKMSMSLLNNKTSELWKIFMPQRKEIPNTLGTDLYSLQVFDPGYFNNFDPAKVFEKWAAMEVTNIDQLPDQLESFTLQGGLYAVFLYKGLSSDNSIFNYIFTEWLPNSGYLLDERPHFEILGEKYKNNDLDSEEEIYIPIRVDDAYK